MKKKLSPSKLPLPNFPSDREAAERKNNVRGEGAGFTRQNPMFKPETPEQSTPPTASQDLEIGPRSNHLVVAQSFRNGHQVVIIRRDADERRNEVLADGYAASVAFQAKSWCPVMYSNG